MVPLPQSVVRSPWSLFPAFQCRSCSSTYSARRPALRTLPINRRAGFKLLGVHYGFKVGGCGWAVRPVFGIRARDRGDTP